MKLCARCLSLHEDPLLAAMGQLRSPDSFINPGKMQMCLQALKHGETNYIYIIPLLRFLNLKFALGNFLILCPQRRLLSSFSFFLSELSDSFLLIFNRAQSWRDQHPAWQYKLWTDVDNHNLVSQHYSWLLQAYDSLPRGIMRADTARYLYMHRHGGV